jgi:hypothetical protein
MNHQLSNPLTIFLLCVIAGITVGMAFTMVGLLRGDRRVREEAAKWMAAADAGRASRRTQESKVDELHQAVQQLRRPPSPPDDSAHD